MAKEARRKAAPRNGTAQRGNLIDRIVAKFKSNPNSLTHAEIDMLPSHVLVPNVGFTHAAVGDKVLDTRALA